MLPQMALPRDSQQSAPATSPMALLSVIVGKESLLPEHTAAFAAAQLLPVIQAATERERARLQGQQYDPNFRRELLVSAQPIPVFVAAGYWRTSTQANGLLKDVAATKSGCLPATLRCLFVSQVMCSYLASSSAWPVLLGHRPLLKLAANLVLATLKEGSLLIPPPCQRTPR